MKRVLALLLLFLVLTGCSLAPDTYLSVKEHTVSDPHPVRTDAVTVEDYAGLKRAILEFVEAGQAQGTIRTSNYDGNVESDLTQAAYEVSKLNPVGAYAVDYMTHDCTFIVNYYEILIQITFRRTLQEIEGIEVMTSQAALRSRLEQALENHETRLAVKMTGYRDPDLAEMVRTYCEAHPDTMMERPAVTVAVYPDSGTVRIVEIDLVYTKTASELEQMERAVQESIDAAAEYIRYRQSDREKTELLFTYLLERFPYREAASVTPLYDALCAGVVEPTGMAQAWQLICDKAGVPCYTVTGLRNGETYTWNIVGNDGYFRHVDLARCVLEQEQLVLLSDGEMGEYYWNADQFPVCEPYPEQLPGEEMPPEEEVLLPEGEEPAGAPSAP